MGRYAPRRRNADRMFVEPSMMIQLADLNAYEFRKGDPIPDWLLELMPGPQFEELGHLIWARDVLLVEWRDIWHAIDLDPEIGKPPGNFIIWGGNPSGVNLHATELPLRFCSPINQLENSVSSSAPIDWRPQKDT
jgi:hypothetical protein